MPDFVRVQWKVKPGVVFKNAPERKIPEKADIYIDIKSGFAYLPGLEKFLLSKNLKTAPFVPNNVYDADCVVLVPSGVEVLGSAEVFRISEDKALLWNFLKERFKGRL
ncbi:hypothetical protein [Succinatimonas hippei]|uniref:hypothetical protein n=1 Tax=Succinatimonas hippei TaxID=626938 RepID=UPI0026E945A3|nr:hypothetical protein [Succinatimonas hippei]